MRATVLLVASCLVVLCGRLSEKAPAADAAVRPLDLVLVLDQSSSMRQTDPANNRITAARFLVAQLAEEWSRVSDHRIGLVNFGDRIPDNPADEFVPLVSLDSAVFSTSGFTERLRPLDLRYTSFISALRRAAAVFVAAADGRPRQRVVVLLTDGEPDDQRKLSRAAYFAELERFVAESLAGTTLYVLGIDEQNRFWPANEPYWRRFARYTRRLASADERALQEAFAAVAALALEGIAEDWRPIPPGGLAVELEPYLEAVKFAFSKETPAARVVITRPDGRELGPKDPGVVRQQVNERTETWRVEEPEPGEWRCAVSEGGGRVDFGTTRIPVQPRLLYPVSPHPQGLPFTIRASFLRKDGQPIREQAAYRLAMWAEIVSPDGSMPVQYELTETGQTGVYAARDSFVPALIGEYRVKLTMKAQRPVTDTTVSLVVAAMPCFRVEEPRADVVLPLRAGVRLAGRLMLSGKELDPAAFFADPADALLLCQVFDGRGGQVGSAHLRRVGEGGRLEGSISGIRRAGRYRVVCALHGRGSDGRAYEYTTAAAPLWIAKQPDLVDFAMGYWYLLPLALLFVLFVWDWQRILRENRWPLWRINLPLLRGRLSIGADGQGIQETRLSGRKIRAKAPAGYEVMVFARRRTQPGRRYAIELPFVEVRRANAGRRGRIVAPDATEEVSGLKVKYEP